MDKIIMWNIVNSLLAGGLVFLGAFTTGRIDLNSVLVAFATAGVVALTQFRDFWKTEEKKNCKGLFRFV
jgi:hypothetical protein